MSGNTSMNNIVIGKRITFGAAVNSLGAVLAHFYPEHAAAIVSACVPIVFIGQLIIVNKFGITQKEL